jgi:hypothetical protein
MPINTERHEIPVGTTKVQTFTLKSKATADAAAAAVDLTGASIELEVEDVTGATVTLGGTASIVTASAGTVQYAPDGAESAGIYHVRWKVTAADGKIEYYPRDKLPSVWAWV